MLTDSEVLALHFEGEHHIVAACIVLGHMISVSNIHELGRTQKLVPGFGGVEGLPLGFVLECLTVRTGG